MKSLSIRMKDKAATQEFSIVHNLRLYNIYNVKTPSYIDTSRTHLNQILFENPKYPIPKNSKEEILKYIQQIEEENRKDFQRLKAEGKIAKNQGYKISQPIMQGILTLSHEAQLDLQSPEKYKQFLDYVKQYLLKLADVLGTELLYAVAHHDETAPHIHFALRNIRIKLGKWTNESGLGKSLSSTFYSESSVRAKNNRDYQIPYSRLQDSLNFFKPLGFSRGIKKSEREQRGEEMRKYIYRNVRQLHEDLPKEILEKKQVISKLTDELTNKGQEMQKINKELNEALRRLKELDSIISLKSQELTKLDDELRLKQQELQTINYKSNEASNYLQKLIDEILLKKHEISLQTQELTNLHNELTNKKQELQTTIKEINKASESLKELSNELSLKTQKLATIHNELINQEQELEKITLEKDKASKTLEQLNNEIANKNQEILLKAQELTTLRNQLTSKKQELEKINKEISENKKKIDNIESQWWQKHQEIIDANIRLKEIKKEYNIIVEQMRLTEEEKERIRKEAFERIKRRIEKEEKELQEENKKNKENQQEKKKEVLPLRNLDI